MSDILLAPSEAEESFNHSCVSASKVSKEYSSSYLSRVELRCLSHLNKFSIVASVVLSVELARDPEYSLPSIFIHYIAYEPWPLDVAVSTHL